MLAWSHAIAGTYEAHEAYERRDYKSALAEFRALAEKGDVEGQMMTGWMYSQGLGGPTNFSEGRKWLERAAAVDGNPAGAKAQHDLGVIYENGIGVPRDLRQAAAWYLRGAKNGDPSAQSNLGTLYLDGQGVERDLVKGIRWLTAAAKQGDAQAYVNLGKVYFEGIGVKRDLARSYFFLDMAVNHSGQDVSNARENLQQLLQQISPSELVAGKRLVQAALVGK